MTRNLEKKRAADREYRRRRYAIEGRAPRTPDENARRRELYAKQRAAEKAYKAGLKQNLLEELEPVAMDHYLSGSADGKTPTQQKRQEYNRQMAQFAKMVNDPESVTPDEADTIGRYMSALAEDEQRFEKRRATRYTAIAGAREALFVRNAEERMKRFLRGKIKASGYALKKSRVTSARMLNLHLSDFHVGAELSADELPVAFGPLEEARRLAKLVLSAAEYKTEYRDKTGLKLYLNGDMIEGLLFHGHPKDSAALADQFNAAVGLLMQALAFLSKHFPRVDVHCQSGNHGRNKLIHPGRATSQKWDSFETMIYVALRYACSNLANVTFDIPKTPYCAVELFDAHAFVTHGDTVLNVGNPAKAIPVEFIQKQINAINATKVFGHKFALFVTGHVHTAVRLQIDSAELLINGAIVPPNGFATSLGYYPACSQWLWESVPGHVVGDSRLIKLDESTDNDASLDAIIKPVRFEG